MKKLLLILFILTTTLSSALAQTLQAPHSQEPTITHDVEVPFTPDAAPSAEIVSHNGGSNNRFCTYVLEYHGIYPVYKAHCEEKVVACTNLICMGK